MTPCPRQPGFPSVWSLSRAIEHSFHGLCRSWFRQSTSVNVFHHDGQLGNQTRIVLPCRQDRILRSLIKMMSTHSAAQKREDRESASRNLKLLRQVVHLVWSDARRLGTLTGDVFAQQRRLLVRVAADRAVRILNLLVCPGLDVTLPCRLLASSCSCGV